MMNTTADRDPLDVIAEEFAERCRRGQMPSVAEYAASHPELAEELRELLPAVAQMEMLKRHRNSSLPTVEPLPENLRSIGDYRIVRELGRGGMGVVYEAVQESLGRRVALKVLPPGARKDATRRERFVRESHTAARLHHTNIVPVFGVGEEKGIPYFVMQYIPGCGLNEVIASWPREMRAESVQDTTTSSIPYHPYSSVDSSIIRRGDWNRIARLGIAAASALHYAHEQGVLHRDMKPGNLLLDHHGQLWVADFGLAKMVDHQTLTETGDLLGTVAYMAPEALQGEFTRQSDIYGLGMTLYELATGRLPFNETTPGPLIRAIGQSDAPPPRKWNPMIPRDLETIVMKAIAREPKRRYTTAEEFADDLRAFVQNRPILARRTSSLGRAILWAKRNPVVAGLSALTALAFLFAFVMGYLSYRGAQFALAQEIKLRKEAEQANEKLEKNLAMSLEAFEDIFDSIGDITPGPPGGRRPDPNGPRPEGMRPGGPNPGGFGGPPSGDPLAVLESILKFFDKFAEQNPTNPKLQLDAAKAYRRVGQIKLRFQQFRDDSVEKGEAALKRSLSILEQLRITAPDTSSLNTEYLLTVAALPPTVERLPLFRDAIRQCEAEGNAERILRDLYERAIPAARKAGDTEFVKQTEPKLMELNNRLPPRPGNFGERGGERGFRGEGGDRPPGRQRD